MPGAKPTPIHTISLPPSLPVSNIPKIQHQHRFLPASVDSLRFKVDFSNSERLDTKQTYNRCCCHRIGARGGSVRATRTWFFLVSEMACESKSNIISRSRKAIDPLTDTPHQPASQHPPCFFWLLWLATRQGRNKLAN